MCLEFEVETQEKLSRIGCLSTRHKALKTPAFWLRHTIRSKPKPWKEKPINTIVTSFYPFLTHKKEFEDILKKGIHTYFGKEKDNMFIMMDAGGFILHKYHTIPFEISELLHAYETSGPDISVVLEHPLNLREDEKENKRRIELTLHETEVMLDSSKDLNIMPVVLGYSPTSLEHVSNSLKKMLQEKGMELKTLGISSVLPFIKTQKINPDYLYYWRDNAKKTCANSREIGIRIVATIRRTFPNTFLHCFGAGGTNMMHILFFLGVDSVDSIGWRLAAAYGSVEIFRKGQRYISTKRYNIAQWATNISPDEVKSLDECQCPACRKDGLEGLRTCFYNRAIHSAFVYYKEAEEARKLISEGRKEYETYLRDRFQDTRLYSLFNHVRTKYATHESLEKFL